MFRECVTVLYATFSFVSIATITFIDDKALLATSSSTRSFALVLAWMIITVIKAVNIITTRIASEIVDSSVGFSESLISVLASVGQDKSEVKSGSCLVVVLSAGSIILITHNIDNTWVSPYILICMGHSLHACMHYSLRASHSSYI